MTTGIISFPPIFSNTEIFSTPPQMQKGSEKREKIKTDEKALALQDSPLAFSLEADSVVSNADASVNNTNLSISRFNAFSSSFMNPKIVENNTQRSTASTSNIAQVKPPILPDRENFSSNNSSPMSFSASFTSLSLPSAQNPYMTPIVLFQRTGKRYEERAKLLLGIPNERILHPQFSPATPEISAVKTREVSQSMLNREASRPKQYRHAFRNLSESFTNAGNSKTQRSGFENIPIKFSSSVGNFSTKTDVQS